MTKEVHLYASQRVSRKAKNGKDGTDGVGITSADVVYISDAPVVFGELLGPGLVTPYVPLRVADLLDQNEKEPLLAQRLSTKVLMYNEEASPDGAPVSNLWELHPCRQNGSSDHRYRLSAANHALATFKPKLLGIMQKRKSASLLLSSDRGRWFICSNSGNQRGKFVRID